MASKVLVKLPTVPFPEGKKPGSDIMTLSERTEGKNHLRQQGMAVDRVAQLNQNMKFLQEQHQATLVALHQEVEALRQKNRDLQFQLVFSKGSTCTASSPSPEDSGTGLAKSKGSLLEILEKDLRDTKTSLKEAKTQNQYLYDVIDQQKKKLVLLQIQVEGRPDPLQADVVGFLKTAEAALEQLRIENNNQRKEIATLKAASSANNGSSHRGRRSRDSNCCGSSASTTQEQTSDKFPPIQSQNYRHRRLPRNGRTRHEKQEHHSEADPTVLPQLQNGSIKTEAVNFESPVYQSRGYRNYYRDESNRKYRGQMSQRDRRDVDHCHFRRDYRDRNSKDHQKELVNAAEGSRDGDHSTGSKS